MNRDDLNLVFVGISAITGLILVLFRLSSSDLLNWIPSVLSGWVGNIIIIVIAAYIGLFFLKHVPNSEIFNAAVNAEALRTLGSIEGCIEKKGVAWKGIAKLQNGRIEDIEVQYKPICPHCQTGLIETTQELSPEEKRQHRSYSAKQQPTLIFLCPNEDCGHFVKCQSELFDEAHNLFERHVNRITETEGKDYSLQALVSNSAKVTPKSVWEEYVKVVDSNDVTTTCFYQ
ncbi:hypothetical protein [Salinigranum sp. GCM10025319]|uniref:hypothetical protein n=1 Tax=Salinigranum sp. GCM10025319 TaxID=3252687 RepID=UPI00361B9674